MDLKEIIASLRAEERKHLAAAKKVRDAIALLEGGEAQAVASKPRKPRQQGERKPRSSPIADFVLSVLSDGKPHNWDEFKSAAIREGLNLDSIKTRLWAFQDQGKIESHGPHGTRVFQMVHGSSSNGTAGTTDDL